MILVVYFAVIFALIATIWKDDLYALTPIILPLSPPLLALLVVLFERPGPAKFWLAGMLLSLSIPAFVVGVDVIGVLAWRAGYSPLGVLLVLLVVNPFGLVPLVWFGGRLPRHCPECGLRALLPLGGRFPRLLWCASCGFRKKV
jgi:hypothetical protein